MCLNVCSTLSEEVANGEWPRTCYKIIQWSQGDGCLTSLYQDYRWRAGVNNSSRYEADEHFNPEEGQTIDSGFHVFLDESQAFGECPSYGIVVQLECNREDFVAAGGDNTGYVTDLQTIAIRTAVFSRVTLSENEWKRAYTTGPEIAIDDNYWANDYNNYQDDWEDDWEDDEYYEEEEWEEEWEEDEEDLDIDEEEN